MFLMHTDIHPSAFWYVLLPGYRIMGWEWAEKCVEGWRKP